jgi:hypothetical protein
MESAVNRRTSLFMVTSLGRGVMMLSTNSCLGARRQHPLRTSYTKQTTLYIIYLGVCQEPRPEIPLK